MNKTKSEIRWPEKIMCGASFAPLAKATEADISQWADDADTFVKLGFNTFRAFAAWDRIEAEKNIRDYTKLDYAFQLAAARNLKVIVNIGGAFENLIGIYPPQWLAVDCHVQHLMEQSGDGYLTGPRHILCMDDPVYRNEAKSFIEETVKRYAKHPSLLAWSVWNEPHWKGCFCPHTLNKFRLWLQARYGSIECLCREWGTEFPVLFREWNDITPPLGTGFHIGGYLPWIDWLEFCEHNLTDSLQWINNLVKKYDCETPTTVNHSAHSIAGVCAERCNFAEIGKVVDIQGVSMYAWGDPVAFQDSGLNRVNCYLSKVRCSSQAPDRNFWLLETEAGPVHWIGGCEPGMSSSAHRRLTDWQAIGLGSKSLLYWLFRSRVTDTQAGEFGMLAWDGDLTERATECGKTAMAINKGKKLLIDSNPYPGQVAVLRCRRAELIAYAEKYEEVKTVYENPRFRYLNASAENAYSIFSDCGYLVDFIYDFQVMKGDLKHYPVLLVPFFPYISNELGSAIRDYVRDGGIVIADCPLGIKDMRAVHWEKTPGCGLQEVFGYMSNDMLPVIDPENSILKWDKCELIPEKPNFRMNIKPSDSAEVVGRFPDKSPAVIENSYINGHSLFFGTMVFRHYDYIPHGEFREQLKAFLVRYGILPHASIRLHGNPEDACRVAVYELTENGVNTDVIIVINKNKNETGIKIVLSRTSCTEWIDLITETSVVLDIDREKAVLKTTLESEGVLVLVPSSRFYETVEAENCNRYKSVNLKQK